MGLMTMSYGKAVNGQITMTGTLVWLMLVIYVIVARYSSPYTFVEPFGTASTTIHIPEKFPDIKGHIHH